MEKLETLKDKIDKFDKDKNLSSSSKLTNNVVKEKIGIPTFLALISTSPGIVYGYSPVIITSIISNVISTKSLKECDDEKDNIEY